MEKELDWWYPAKVFGFGGICAWFWSIHWEPFVIFLAMAFLYALKHDQNEPTNKEHPLN